MLPFKLNGAFVRTFHLMLTTHLADSLSPTLSLIAWSAIMANWETVHNAKKARPCKESPGPECMAHVFNELASGSLTMATDNHQAYPSQPPSFLVTCYF